VDSEINFTILSEMGDAATPEVPEYVESVASLTCQCLLSNPLPAVDLPLKAEMEAYKRFVSRLSLLVDRNEGMSRVLNLNVLCTVIAFISDLFLGPWRLCVFVNGTILKAHQGRHASSEGHVTKHCQPDVMTYCRPLFWASGKFARAYCLFGHYSSPHTIGV